MRTAARTNIATEKTRNATLKLKRRNTLAMPAKNNTTVKNTVTSVNASPVELSFWP